MRESCKAEDGARIALEEGLHRDNKAKCIKEEGEADLSQGKKKTIIELNEEEGKLLKDVRKEEEPIEDCKQHHDGLLVRCQREIDLLEYFLKEQECESVTTVKIEGVSQALFGTKICVICEVSYVLPSKEE